MLAPPLLLLALAPLQGALADPADLAEVLEPIRDAHGVPALAGAAFDRDGLLAVGAVGLRSAAGEEAVEVDDRWHLGSCTKAMTATLAARMVEQGKIDWDTSVADVFADLPGGVDPGWEWATLELLLAHRGGAPADIEPELDDDDRESALAAHRDLQTALTRFKKTLSPPGPQAARARTKRKIRPN